jgi:hypothetical protein
MTEDRSLLGTLIDLYARSLVAKAQLREFEGSWSSGIQDGFRTTIEEHRAAEVSYIDHVIEQRRKSTEALKKAVEEAEAEVRQRKLRR